jgi:hypothetical protein
MKPSKQAVIIAIILSAGLFFIGLYTWGKFFDLILPIVGNVKYLSTSMTWQFKYSKLFGLTLALIPIATILIWRFAPIFNKQRRILTVCIIILALTVAVFSWREIIKAKATNLQPTTILDYSDPSNPQPKTFESGIPIESLNFELFALGGLIVGSLIAFFSLRQNKTG